MRDCVKCVVAVTVFGMVLLAGKEKAAYAKTQKISLDLRGSASLVKFPAVFEKSKKVKVKCSNKSVVRAKYRTDRKFKRVEFQGKKKGTAVVTVKCILKKGGTKTIKYKVKVIKSKKVSALDKAKKAFQIQNGYRKEKGRAELEWSDELYRFCLYRIKSSGFDGHKNLVRDTSAYFGVYAKFRKIMFAENLYYGYTDPESAMKAWKNSLGHYQNLLSPSHKCGAIARIDNTWCAVFYDKDKSEIDNFRNYQIKEIKVKRYDSTRNVYVSGSSIGYYEADDHWGTLQVAGISRESGKFIYLEIGKTYVIYEQKAPDGYGKAERVIITVTEDSPDEVILAS